MRQNKSNAAVAAGLVAIAVLFALPTAAAADIDGDVRFGLYDDTSEGFAGLGLLMRLDRARWFFNPNVEYVFVDRGDLVTLNADVHYDVLSEGATDVWLGGGPALVMVDGPFGRDETDFGVNLLAGVGFQRDAAVRPFLQGKLLLSDHSEAVIAFGARF